MEGATSRLGEATSDSVECPRDAIVAFSMRPGAADDLARPTSHVRAPPARTHPVLELTCPTNIHRSACWVGRDHASRHKLVVLVDHAGLFDRGKRRLRCVNMCAPRPARTHLVTDLTCLPDILTGRYWVGQYHASRLELVVFERARWAAWPLGWHATKA